MKLPTRWRTRNQRPVGLTLTFNGIRITGAFETVEKAIMFAKLVEHEWPTRP